MDTNEKLKAAYALNLWTVSISQIIDYNDTYVLEQEYNTIMNNLNLERMPKDDALLDIIKEILDEITYLRMDEGDRKMLERRYQHQLKNAVWSAVPNVGAIFTTKDPVVMGVTLASMVGIGYMNYRRKKAEYGLENEEAKWQIQKNRMQHLHGLQKQLFETSWHLAERYGFQDKYRLTERQISQYNEALVESNLTKRYNKLDAMQRAFDAYPAFWYQLGSTANSIYRSDLYRDDSEIREFYRANAIKAFERYRQLNTFNLLRHDVLTSAWALEYLELMDMSQVHRSNEARELIEIAEQYSGNAKDVLELCAFAYLRIQDEGNAVRLFRFLVNEDYNAILNTQILSGLYIKRMRDSDPTVSMDARVGYKQLSHITDSKYILEIPDEHIDLSRWKPAWNREEDFEEFVERKKQEQHQDQIKREEKTKQARTFYQKPIRLVYKKEFEDIAEYFLGVINENRENIDPSLPYASRCDLNEYKKKREEFERQGIHVILVGDSDEAKKLYKNAKNGWWDYYHLGMRYMSYGNKTVILARSLKNNQINDLILLARNINESHPVKIPANVETVSYSFMKSIFEEADFSDPTSGIATVLATLVMSPLLVLGQAVENIWNSIQFGINLSAAKKLEFLQYCIALYQYLDSENALAN